MPPAAPSIATLRSGLDSVDEYDRPTRCLDVHGLNAAREDLNAAREDLNTLRSGPDSVDEYDRPTRCLDVHGPNAAREDLNTAAFILQKE